jgi:Holliday junction resolvase RusA-like endonuclease
MVFTMPAPRRPKPHQMPGMPHTQRPDLDNLVKLACDALNGLMWTDDAQVACVSAAKVWGSEGRTDVKVWQEKPKSAVLDDTDGDDTTNEVKR